VHPQKIANGALQTFAAWRQALRVDAQFTKRFSAYTEPIIAYARKNVAGYDSSADHKTRTEIEQLPLLPSFGIKYSF